MAFTHAADDITLGRGELYFFPFLAGTTTPSKDGRYFGNTPGFNLSASVEKLAHFSADRGLKVKDRNVTLSVDYTGTMECDNINADNLADCAANLTIQAASIDTKNADRDGHLKSADFLDVENFATITFASTDVSLKGDAIEVVGDLTIHGVTNKVVIPFELVGVSQDPWGNTKAGFEGETEISRKDFGLTWNAALETGGVLVGDDIKLNLDVEGTKQA